MFDRRTRKTLFLVIPAGLVAVAVAGIVLLAVRGGGAPSGTSHFPWIVLLPVYAALIPIYVGAARGRREKNKHG